MVEWFINYDHYFKKRTLRIYYPHNEQLNTDKRNFERIPVYFQTRF